jgi:hypothetical protein
MAKKVKFGKKKPSKKRRGSTEFHFGANAAPKKRRRGGFGGGS